jgi:hypothetical protein
MYQPCIFFVEKIADGKSTLPPCGAASDPAQSAKITGHQICLPMT